MALPLLDLKEMKIAEQNLEQLKSIGLSYLEKGDFREAVKIYKQILLEYPDDVEAYMLLGDLYLATEDYPSSEKLYEKALSLEPDNIILQRRLKLSTSEHNTRSSTEIPTDSDSVSKLLQEITGREKPISEDEIQTAATLLNDIVHNENPAEMVASHLDQIDSLLPALIELNIRQARNDRRFDLVNMLQALQESVSQLIQNPGTNQQKRQSYIVNTDLPVENDQIKYKNVLFLLPDQENLSERIRYCMNALQSKQVNTMVYAHDKDLEKFDPDLIIASNPHIQSNLMEKMVKYSAKHIPVILDLDDDFEYLPINHPDYPKAGLGSLEKSRSYTASMLFSNLITVPGESIANHIRESGYKTEVIPFGWTRKNENWLKSAPSRSFVNIGLIGIQGNFEDVQQYRRIIIRVLREFPLTRLVVCGDSTTYKLFENINESRRIFLPTIPHEDMSYAFSQIDILL